MIARTQLACLVLASVAAANAIGATTNNDLLARALAGPLKDSPEIVFCTRSRYDDPHWYANIGYYCDDANHKAYAGNGKPDAGRLCKLDLRSGAVTNLLDAQGGSIRDPQVHYDAKKILFSLRPAGTDFYHLHEINVDGSGLRQLTDGPWDDFEPTYLPDGDIVFVSTRCKRWVNCWYTQVATMHRCDADGKNIVRISANTEHDNTPWVLPDGRLLYMRWEYVDRSQVEYHGLWTMNPDGTDQNIYFGNMYSWTVMLDAKPVPGTRSIVACFSPGHGHNEHAGPITIVSNLKGPDDQTVPQKLAKGAMMRDPYSLATNLFMAAREAQIVLLDTKDHVEAVFKNPDGIAVHEPRPIRPRPREPVIPRRTLADKTTGKYFLADVYRGRKMDGVQRGEIKKLLVLESLPKPVNFSGGMDLTSWCGAFTLERVLGTVPVEADGSAYFEAPATRQLFFVGLDDHDLSVKRMQSWTSVMPGETMSCVGCHELRSGGPAVAGGQPLALRRDPSRIESFAGQPDVLDFNRDVQPILDRHCVSCHGPEKYAGGLTLAGDLGSSWSISYFSLLAHRLVVDGRNGLGNQPPRTIGSSASPLLNYGDGKHHDAKFSAQEWRTLWMWIEAGAPYAGSYAGLRNTAQQEENGKAYAVFALAGAQLHKRCAQCHEVGAATTNECVRPLPMSEKLWRGDEKKSAGRPTASYERIVATNDPIARYDASVLLNMTRPEFSPLLQAPLAKAGGGWEKCGAIFHDKNDPDYQAILAAFHHVQKVSLLETRWGMPGFKPNEQYIREMKRFGVLPENFDRTKDPLDVFKTDQAYWQSLWYKPPAQTADAANR